MVAILKNVIMFHYHAIGKKQAQRISLEKDNKRDKSLV